MSKGWIQALLILVTAVLASAGMDEWAVFFAVILVLSAFSK